MKDNHEIQEKQPGSDEPAQQPVSNAAATLVIVLTIETAGAGREPRWQWRVRSVETGAEGRFWRVDEVLAFVAAVSGYRTPL